MSDVWYSIRSLLSARWFALGAALTFALGIGVNLAVFSAVDRMLFRTLPYANPHELLLLRVCSAPDSCNGSFPSILAYEGRQRLQTIGEMAVAGPPGPFRVSTEPSEERQVRLIGVSPNLLRVLGVKPVLGRDMTDEDLRDKQRVVLLGYETWQRRFAGASNIVGRVFGSSAAPATVIGILPRDFIPPTWTAMDPTWDGLVLDAGGWATIGPKGGIMVPFARLAPEATRDAAQAEVRALVETLAGQLRQPGSPADAPLPNVRLDRIDAALFSRFQDYAWLIVAAAAVVLLMACANLAGLLLARGRSREREAAIRSALGASPMRIVRSAILETAAVCALGAIVAVVVLAGTTQALVALLPPLFSRYLAGVADVRVLVFALGVAAMCAVAAGVWPGVRMARVDIKSVLQGAGRTGRRSRLRGGRSLLAVEAALGVFLVLAALLAVRSFSVLAAEDIGFRPESLYRVTVSAPANQPPAQDLAEYEQMLQVLTQVPGVTGVGGGDSVVSSGATAMRGFSSDRPRFGGRYEVSAGYFAALDSELLAGREFTEGEISGRSLVAIVNASAAAAVWSGLPFRDVVGQTLSLGKEASRQVVGVAKDLRDWHGADVRPALYVPLGAEPRFYRQMLIRAASGATPALAIIRERITGRVGQRTVSLAPVASSLEPSLQDPRFRAVLFATLGLCALLLAAAGLYALAAFETSLRQHEMGVRMSLGASARRIRALVLREAVWPVVFGSAAGLTGAWWTARFLQAFLYKVEARDPWAYAFVALVLLGTAVLAAWLPARRASRVDPAVVLRAQ